MAICLSILTGSSVRCVLMHIVVNLISLYLILLAGYTWAPSWFSISDSAFVTLPHAKGVQASHQPPAEVICGEESYSIAGETVRAFASTTPDGPSSSQQPSRTLAAVSTATLLPRNDGVLLDKAGDCFSSPNGVYQLTLKETGDVVLERHEAAASSPRPLWWTSTGDRRMRDRRYRLAFSSDPIADPHDDDQAQDAPPEDPARAQYIADNRPAAKDRPRLSVQRGSSSGSASDDGWETVWHSDLEPACHGARDSPSTPSPGDGGGGGGGGLTLDDSGALRVAGRCDLHLDPAAAGTNRSLALLVAGLYRTLGTTCATHAAKLLGHGAFARVDVFVYALYTREDLEAGGPGGEEGGGGGVRALERAVRDCYGANLKAVDLAAAAAGAAERFPAAEGFVEGSCGPNLHRLQSQLRTLHEAGRRWWAWTVRAGFRHDTVMRIRPDTVFVGAGDGDVGDGEGDAVPVLDTGGPGGAPELNMWSLEELGADTLVMPHPGREEYFYCPRASGGVQVGTTDQIAYGHPAAMWAYLNMYQDFSAAVELGNPGRNHSAARVFSGCEALPAGPAQSSCARPMRCPIECMVPWYLDSRGVRVAAEWDWRHGMRRADRTDMRAQGSAAWKLGSGG